MVRSNTLSDATEKLATMIADREVNVQELLECQLIDRKSKEESREIEAAKRIQPRRWAKLLGISYMSVQRMLKKDLGMKLKKELKAQLLTNRVKKMRLDRCKK
jgi:hypothetical protein